VTDIKTGYLNPSTGILFNGYAFLLKNMKYLKGANDHKFVLLGSVFQLSVPDIPDVVGSGFWEFTIHGLDVPIIDEL
jgi:hypothetical protein